jgi:hypothetical protein
MRASTQKVPSTSAVMEVNSCFSCSQLSLFDVRVSILLYRFGILCCTYGYKNEEEEKTVHPYYINMNQWRKTQSNHDCTYGYKNEEEEKTVHPYINMNFTRLFYNCTIIFY